VEIDAVNISNDFTPSSEVGVGVGNKTAPSQLDVGQPSKFYSPNQSIASIEESKPRVLLPTEKPLNKNDNGTINFPGSSYSGADIKLVVQCRANEIYGEKRKQKQDDLKNLEKDYNNRLVQLYLQETDDEALRQADESYAISKSSLEKEIVSLNNDSSIVYVPLATVQTLSIQSFREKFAVRALGFNQSKGTTRGPRTVAGSIIFTSFDEHALARFLQYPPTIWAHEKGQSSIRALPDQLPPMTISAIFANEYGSISQMTIYGIEFISDGMTMSIEDIFTENVCQYIARDYDVLLRRERIDLEALSTSKDVPTSGSDLLRDPAYKEYSKRFGIKRNPYM